MVSVRGMVIGVATVIGMACEMQSASAWTDDNPSAASQCVAADVNDAGTVVENCKVADASIAYVVLSGSATQLSPLSSTPGGAPCHAQMINNAQLGRETVAGWCQDANLVKQGVVWSSISPGSPLQLTPLGGLLGVGAGVRTEVTSVSAQGTVVGSSIDANKNVTPVYWAAGFGVANALAVPLLAQQTNCVAIYINNAGTPSVVGSCPAANGKTSAVLWTNVSSAYTTLPVPSGASYCVAQQINLTGQILGNCLYGDDSRRVVLWGTGGTGPSVLATINGVTAQRSVGAYVNDSGLVAVNFLGQGAQAGFSEPAIWNPSSANASEITLPSGAIHGEVLGVGDNGKMVGNFETSGGTIHPFHVEPGSLTAVDDGSPEGGANAEVRAYSVGGTVEVGTAESGNESEQSIVQSIP
ncbi:hypothetical protein [Burkholderia alba]|uniref:hypothetical protein n=1 Tax=Burkholderia alba TaxID=2683677 RepID=UPI002B05B6A1|nr:hypothetical protein [Burkholderia alba]